VTTLRENPRERRAWATLLVLARVTTADRVLHAANKVGRGI
jgi:hypothetical protein